MQTRSLQTTMASGNKCTSAAEAQRQIIEWIEEGNISSDDYSSSSSVLPKARMIQL